MSGAKRSGLSAWAWRPRALLLLALMGCQGAAIMPSKVTAASTRLRPPPKKPPPSKRPPPKPAKRPPPKPAKRPPPKPAKRPPPSPRPPPRVAKSPPPLPPKKPPPRPPSPPPPRPPPPPAINKVDGAALVALAKAWNYSFKGAETWRLEYPCAWWSGVTCDPRSGRVTEINLTGAGVSGIISPEINGLSYLSALYLADNKVTGKIPYTLGNSYLRRLDLHNNYLTGLIPKSLADNAFYLNYLDLSGNQLTGHIPRALQSLALFQMSVANNYLWGDWCYDGAYNASGNCLSTSACGEQKSPSQCSSFCGATDAGGVCSGNGYCSSSANTTSFVCHCNASGVTAADCAPKGFNGASEAEGKVFRLKVRADPTLCLNANIGLGNTYLDTCQDGLSSQMLILQRWNLQRPFFTLKVADKGYYLLDDNGVLPGQNGDYSYFYNSGFGSSGFRDPPQNENQWWYYETASGLLRSAYKDNGCIDNGASYSSFPYLDQCNGSNSNQVWDLEVLGPANYLVSNVLIGEFFILQSRARAGLCVDARSAGYSSLQSCSGHNSYQVLVFQRLSQASFAGLIKLSGDSASCLNETGGFSTCNTSTQLWYLEFPSGLLRLTGDTGGCLDGSAAAGPGGAALEVKGCNGSNSHQTWDLYEPGFIDGFLQAEGKAFLLEGRTKPGLCLDGSYGSSKTAWLMECQEGNLNQLMVFARSSLNSTVGMLRLARPGDYCLDDAGAQPGKDFDFKTYFNKGCSTGQPLNENQWWYYDGVTGLVRSAYKDAGCIDDGGYLQGSVFWLNECQNNLNEYFNVKVVGPINAILTGAELNEPFLLKSRSKTGLCVDAASAGFPSLWNCAANNSQQLFVFQLVSGTLGLIKLRGDQSSCLNSTGGFSACDNSTRWYLEGSSGLLRLDGSGGGCLDDAGATGPGKAALRVTSDCNSSNTNQVWDVLPPGFVDGLLQADGKLFMLQSRSTPGLCVDAGKGHGNAWLQDCQPNNKNQVMVFVRGSLNTTLGMLQLAQPGDYCLDDREAQPGQQYDLKSYFNRGCTASPLNESQWWSYDSITGLLLSAYKDGGCLDNDGSYSGSDLWLNLCDKYNGNELFDVLVLGPANVLFKNLETNEPFTLKSRNKKGLCADARTAGFPSLWNCSISNAQQVFLYQPVSGTVGLITVSLDGDSPSCLNQTGGFSTCDNSTQLWYLDGPSGLLHLDGAKGGCLNDGGATAPGGAALGVSANCDSSNTSQVWDLHQPGFPNDFLKASGKKFLLKRRGSSGLCLYANLGGDAILRKCQISSPGQIMVFVPGSAERTSGFLQLALPGNYCLDDSGVQPGESPSEKAYFAEECPGDKDQWWYYDNSTGLLHSANKVGGCIDSSSSLWLNNCDPTSTTQLWDLQLL